MNEQQRQQELLAMKQLVYRYLPDRQPAWDARMENLEIGGGIATALFLALEPLKNEIAALKARLEKLERPR